MKCVKCKMDYISYYIDTNDLKLVCSECKNKTKLSENLNDYIEDSIDSESGQLESIDQKINMVQLVLEKVIKYLER